VDSPENANALLGKLFEDVCSLGKRYNALFEWVDGPLVEAMKNGDYILLDEMSLADDAVLERLNSLLEPSRSIVLAEMGSALDSESSTIEAKDGFQLFATMNPGGDFGKRELSPALRNRFTEIWVPPVTDSIDVDLVLERTLAGQTPVHIKVKIMEYFDWFNNDVCCDPRNPNFEMCLSLRDVLTWAEFIVAASKSCPSIDIWDLYRQGAYLMHLDGIGLGTGMGRDRANKLKSMAESFLTQQLTDCMQFANSERSNSNLFRIEHGKFGRSPFWIEMGSRAANDPLFDFEAPTTSTNLIRVLRAMQLRKPILLEGCPGAGKTGLVEALAVAAGHRLVRINLSEQSDISDLFGSDLPLSEDNSRSRGAFQWCDGVLLSAIKSGDWVLLDELNLAPQSVLEGLNSCLDHRSAVYIPEIGQSFICPKSFRVFAAQNPVAQGGGRKGLPKSFLNRFTKVYVDPLTSHDFSCIIHKAFPGLDKSMVTSMIRFNEKIHIDSVERMEIGRTGGPWEFNLRDIFRWCDLCVRNDSPSSSCPVFARDLYTQRFRSVDDRVAVAATFESLFEGQALSLRTPRISSTQTVFRVGTVTLPKNIGSSRPLYEFTTSETDPLMSLLEPLEAVVRCASMRWPCLLVGDSRDAISSIVNVAAESTGVKVLDVCLSPSSDVSELIGCFEQVDTSEEYRAALRDLANIAVEYAIHPDAKEIDRVLDFVVRLSHSDQPDRNAIVCAQDLTSILAESGNKVGDESFIERMGVTIEKVREISSTTPDILGRNNLFIWKDGPLVEAMSSGFWIHFHNVNLCPATVLDRLNPVLEPGGSLVLSECGTNITNEKGKAHRELVPHPNFTAFLSMDPMNGEISRAMRNRCVEVSLIDSVEPERGAIDCSNAAWRSKLFLPLTGTTWIGNSEFRSITRSKLLGRFISSLTRRGNGRKWVRRLLREDIDIAAAFSAAGQQQVTVSRIETKSCPPLRGGWVVAPLFSQISWEARILRQSGSDFDFSAFALDNNEDTMVLSRNVLLNRFLVRHTREDLIWRALYLSRIASGTGAALQFLAERCARLCALASTSGSSVIQTVNFGVADPRYLLWFLLTRGPQALTEASWLRSHMSEQDRDSVSVLRASQLIASGGLIMAPDTCPVTPSLMPLFLSLDEMCGALIDVVLKSNSGGAIVESLIGVLSTRDELWNLLNTIKFTPHTSRYLHFEDDTEFNVLWTEFRKVLSAAEVTFLRFLDPYKHLFCQRINDLVESIDSAVFGPNGNKAAEHLNVMQGFPLPLVPKTSSDWSLVLDTYSFDNCFAICGGLQSANERTDTIDLERLINICHPILFVTRKTKRDIIDANIMGRLASLGNELGPLAEALPKLDPDVAKAIGSDILCLKASFVSQMRHFKVGVGLNRLNSAAALGDVQTDDDFFQATNEQEPEVLDSGLDFERISESLLDRFARIQLSPIAQCYCERMERMNIELLYGWLLGVISMDSLQRDLSVPSLSSLLDFMIVEAQWTPSEVVCHETLLWLAEASLLTNRQITRRLLPMMTTYASRHTLKGSSFLCRYISPKLELPKAGGETIEVNKMRERNSRVGFSNCRTTQGNVPDVVVFSLIGREFWPHRSRELVAGAAFLTIENCVVRDRQCRTLTGLLAALDCSFQSQMIHELTYKLFETLLALGASSLSGEKCLLDSLTTGPPEPPEIIMSEIGHLVDVFKLPITAIVIIWRCLHSAWRIRADAGIEVTQKSDLGSKEIAIAGAFIGLIRFHVFLPVSAVDPGRRPQGVVSLLNRRLVRLSIEDAACRLETSLIDAGMKKDTHEALARRSEISRIVTSRAKQEAEIIRRPAKCPAFVDLYQELHDFASDIMPIDAMAEFIQLLTTCSETASKHGHDALVQRESHFQVTAEGFCDRLLHHFGAYEDVVAPLVDAVEGMRVGLATISRAVAGEGSAQTTLHNLTNFCSGVPLGEEDGIRNLLKYAASASDFTHDRTLERDAALAVLSRLVVTRAVHGMDQKLLVLWDDVISRVMPKQDAGFSYCSPDATTEKDMTDVEYQQLFPNYRRAFEALCIKSDDDVTVPDSTNDDSVTTRTPHDFEDEELELLQRIHSDFFADSTHIDNSMWLRAFRLSYGVAARLFEVEERETASIYVHGYARHALAISMCSTAYFNDTAQCPCASPDRDFSDFHRDPSPSEVSKAKLPLDKLQARVNQLLSCFPENSVLDVIAKVTDRVKKLNLLSCSVSRAMGGLEVVLKNAQDWEQHASKRFQIGEPLILLSNLISRWRKLELQSWAHLLRAREVRCEKRSQKYWFKLHSVLIASASEPQAGDTVLMCEENAHLFVPKWVWKGCAAQGHRLASPHNLASADLTDVLEAVDTFVLTATLAEFEVRLEMIRAFARQLSYEYRLRGSTSRTVLLAHALRWLAFYYEQFSSQVADCIAECRKPFEKKLEEQSKLAKWDEQSYYSLAESSERNHRALMTVLRGYDEKLDKNVGIVLDEVLCSGVRRPAEEADTASTLFPQHDVMFSCVTADEVFEQRSDGNVHDTGLNRRAWVDPALLGAGERSYCSRIAQLARKISEVQDQSRCKQSFASNGRTQVSTMSSAIFERLDSLRSGKATRPMKERALVDLVKELKRQGFAPGKWQVPAEIKSMGSIWQLPCWNLSKLNTLGQELELSLVTCDKYIQRCLAEAPRLRHEVSVIGSRHLPLRQIEMLLNLSESGLLLTIQQRCSLFLVLNERQRLESLVKILDLLCNSSIPGGQSELISRFMLWMKDTRLAAESVKELRIFLANMVDQVEDPDKSKSTRVLLHHLDAYVQDAQIPEMTEALLLAEHDVKDARRSHEALDAMTSRLKTFRNDLVGVLPLEPIVGCVCACEKSLESGFSFLDFRPDFAACDSISLQAYLQAVSNAVEATLMSVQVWTSSALTNDADVDEVATIWDSHRKLMQTWGSINVRKIATLVTEVVAKLKCVHDDQSESEIRDNATWLTTDLLVLVKTSLESTDQLLRESIDFHRETSKLQYVLLRVFRILVSKGFCASPNEDESHDSGNDPAGGTTFEESQGVGMGEGDGIQDVTEQLESEEQLLGLKGEKDENERSSDNPRQLGDEEAKQGMEMEENFDGDMFDVPRDHENDSETHAGDDDKEEVEREMGEGGLNDEVLDERMWNEDDDEGSSPSEKLEDGSNVPGAPESDEITTKDDTAEKNLDNESEILFIQKEKGSFQPEESVEDVIKDDASENHEENHESQVSSDDPNRERTVDAGVLELDEQLSLGDDGSASKDEEEASFEEDLGEAAEENSVSAQPESGDESSRTESGQDNAENDANFDVTITDPQLGNESEPLKDDKHNDHCLSNHQKPQTGLGVSAIDGKDAVGSQDLEELGDQADGKDNMAVETAGAQSDLNDGHESREGVSEGSDSQGRTPQQGEGDTSGAQAEPNKVPNPLMHPADAALYWHRKLNVIRTDEAEVADAINTNESPNDPKPDGKGDFEHTKVDGPETTLMLGEVDEEDATPVRDGVSQDGSHDDERVSEQSHETERDQTHNVDEKLDLNKKSPSSKQHQRINIGNGLTDKLVEEQDDVESVDIDPDGEHLDEDTEGDKRERIVNDTGNQVVSDISQLQGTQDGESIHHRRTAIVEDDVIADLARGGDIQAVHRTKDLWSMIHSETHHLARRLCEKLRLVMEPLVASKLRGDYRTGKRINMKRVIGYIASGYRRDKIWLRRTKPAKRNYRVLVAVDDSESMRKSGAGEMALRAMATLAIGMSQLDIGQIGLASFGDEMRVLHPFDRPFTPERGPEMVRQFSFAQPRTRTALCVESTLRLLDTPGDHASMQLVFMISDGRIERDSRTHLRRLLREMHEKNILLALVIVEGEAKKDSILTMREVAFQKGKPVVKRFIDDYPFPYYIILNDMQSLPEVLGDALRQWFEMLARLHGR
jgi:MoxR-like ATPase